MGIWEKSISVRRKKEGPEDGPGLAYFGGRKTRRLRWREEEGKRDYMSLSVSVFIPLWWDVVGGLRASKAAFISL